MNTSYPGANNDLFFKRLLFSLCFLIQASFSLSQEIHITCTDEPLNKILLDLRDRYDLMVSFDDRQLSSYKLTIDKTFGAPRDAIDHLLKGLPLGYEVRAGVYVIFTVQVEAKTRARKYIIAGRITDKTTGETLPYSGILVNNKVTLSDAKGVFSYTSASDSIFTLRISYLGYYILDTVLQPGTSYNFALTPSVIALQEVIVEGSYVAKNIETGTSPGIARMNHKIAYYLPGNGDNSIFNLLRLQPGILAAGEQSADFIIWGSYEGQSQVLFDGFTIYGMKNFNDNISAVNPYMAKDIKVLKGAFGAEYGERVGGIVDITGRDGNRLSPSAQFNINNMTLNGIVSVPFRKKSALMLAYRQTFYALYDSFLYSTMGIPRRGYQGGSGSTYNYAVYPDYGFRDMNIKYSGSGKKSNYYVSLYGGMDHFSYDFFEQDQRRSTTLEYGEQNIQAGGSAFYGYRWKEKNTSSLAVSYSTLQTDRAETGVIERIAGRQNDVFTDEQSLTAIHEANGKMDNRMAISEHHMAEAGLGLLYYRTTTREGTSQLSPPAEISGLHVPYLYLQDNITVFTNLTIRPGLRTDYHSIANRLYVQPRLSLLYRFNDFVRVNAAGGVYNQFVAKNMIIDTAGNYRLVWALCDNNNIRILNSHGYTLGFSFLKNNFTVSIEGYLKFTGGMTRFLETSDGVLPYYGKGRTRGLDIFVKKDFKNQTLWVSYTLSKTEEHFSYFPLEDYVPAMHDQRHEIKLAGLAKFKSLHFSANYVFGSGFPDPDQLPAVVAYNAFYSRLDGAVIYRFLKRKIHIDAGISVMNVLGRKNIRHSNLIRIPADETGTVSLYADAVPRTLALFLNIYY